MRRRYSDEERAAALAALKANDGNLTRTAQQVGVPLSTLKEWSDNPDRAASTEVRNQKKEELAVLFEKVARAYISRALTDEAINETRGKDAVIAAATATDKRLLLTGEATDRLEVSELTDEQRTERLYGLAERIRQRRAGATQS